MSGHTGAFMQSIVIPLPSSAEETGGFGVHHRKINAGTDGNRTIIKVKTDAGKVPLRYCRVII